MATSELSGLVSMRGRIKSKLTMFKTYLEKAATDSVKRAELPSRLEKAEGLWHEYNMVQNKIEDLDTSETQLIERESFEDSYHAIITSARALQPRPDRASQSNSVNFTLEPSTSDHQFNILSQPQRPTKVKLPNIELPKFDGNYNRWIPFRELFESLIDANTSLPPIQKLHYLKLSLTNEAAQIIQSLELSNANYEIAWNLLKQRYENKRLIVQHHMQELLDLTPITRESHAALRQLLDGISQHVQPMLIKLGQPVEHWSTILIHIITPKLDKVTKREWKLKRATIDAFPTLDEFIEFLNTRSAFLESLSHSNSNVSSVSSTHKSNNKSVSCACVSDEGLSCPICQGQHKIYDCSTFRNWSPSNRLTEAKGKRLCIKCLKKYHGRSCKASGCRRCKGYHNTLLHLEGVSKSDNVKEKNQAESPVEPAKISSSDKQTVATVTQASTATLTHCTTKGPLQVILSTAIIYIKDRDGALHECRALLDSDSQSNFITSKLSDCLKLSKQQTTITVTGISETPLKINQQVTATIRSCHNAFQTTLPFLTINRITERLPLNKIDVQEVQIPEGITLADPTFHTPAEVDVLLGASVFWDLLCVGQIKPSKHQPIFQKTRFGWIISGAMELNRTPIVMTTYCGFSSEQMLCNQLQKFWQMEEVESNYHLSPEEIKCEEHYRSTISRADDDRFVVQLPLKMDPSTLGESYDTARKQFQAIERKLNRDHQLKKQYHEFMEEYFQLGHMSEGMLYHPTTIPVVAAEEEVAEAESPVYEPITPPLPMETEERNGVEE
ncbi:PREDICTED: uncharacterized protein LOC105448555 [Wasmannia auropunctata]|uniref:uncharacterized protein LOC105448555 n=1 Tax=Wasmannia auropunctata TaxID=64793 RepID=UPI0005EE6873|nr:PREDICTED: uncharacterized protein LOC105448555 [Wasmannia auropunctata]